MSDTERVCRTFSANYRPLISSAVTATLSLHVNDGQMGPHILPPAQTMASLKTLETPKRDKAKKDATPRPSWRRLSGAGHRAPPPPAFTSARPSSSSPWPNLGTFARIWSLCLPFVVHQRCDEGEKRRRRGARGAGLEVKGTVALVALICLLLLQEGWGGLARSLVVALHTNTGREKHKAHLFDSLILLPQGELVGGGLHRTGMRYSAPCPSLPLDSHRSSWTAWGWTETRQMGGRPRQEIADHNSMKLNQFVQ